MNKITPKKTILNNLTHAVLCPMYADLELLDKDGDKHKELIAHFIESEIVEFKISMYQDFFTIVGKMVELSPSETDTDLLIIKIAVPAYPESMQETKKGQKVMSKEYPQCEACGKDDPVIVTDIPCTNWMLEDGIINFSYKYNNKDIELCEECLMDVLFDWLKEKKYKPLDNTTNV